MKRFCFSTLIALFILASLGLASFAFAAAWPDNEFISIVPKPPFSYVQTHVNDPEYFNASMTGVTAENFRSYKQALKDQGFTTVVGDEEDDSLGFHFKALNSDGWLVEVSFYPRSPDGQGGLSISKEK